MSDASTIHPLNAADLGTQIAARLHAVAAQARLSWSASAPIRHCVIDGLLPDDTARVLFDHFPDVSDMRLRDTFRERKYVSAQMDRHDPNLQAAIFAFHEPAVVDAVRRITGKADLEPDPELYAGGLSRMQAGHFLNPHLDNSHDGERRRWRNLNLLFYVSPDAAPGKEMYGGELELWPQGPSGGTAVTIPARFNRLVIMETHQRSWHSVRPLSSGPGVARCCVSNYYFAPTPMRDDQAFHVTCFRARPGQPFRDLCSRLDGGLRMALRRLRPAGWGHGDHRFRR